MTRHGHRASALLVVIACCGLSAQQPERTQTEALTRRAADRLRSLHDEADRLASEERTLLGDLRRLELQREIRAEELRQVEADTAQVSSELTALDAQIASLENQERLEAPELNARLVSLYKLGRGRYIRLLLSTSSVRRIGQASRLVGNLAVQDRNRVATHQRRLGELNVSRLTLEERQSRLQTLRVEAERARMAADAAVNARNTMIRAIDERRDLNAQLVGELFGAQQKLQTTLSGIASGAEPSLPISPFQGDLDWPVPGTVRQAFGQSDQRRAAGNGLDIAAAAGASVHAVHDGVVAFADAFSGFGRLVIVDHGAQTFSLYGNLDDLAAAKGTRVARGDVLGTVGVSATGAIGLYFELRVDGRPVDPLQWLKKR